MVEQTQIEDRDPNQGSLKVGFAPDDVDVWRKHLDEEGFVVLKGVMSEEDVEEAKSKVFDWIEGLNSGVKRDDSETWKNTSWPGSSIGFLRAQGGGQTEASWLIRSHPNVIKAFQDIWRSE